MGRYRRFWTTFPEVGATPISMAKGEMYMAGSTGVIDGVVYSTTSVLGMKLYELWNYYSLWGETAIAYLILVDQASLDALPQNIQDSIWKRADELNEELWDIGFYGAEEVAAAVKAQGVEFIPVSAEEVARLRAITSSFYDEWLDKTGAEGLATLNDALAAVGQPPYR